MMLIHRYVDYGYRSADGTCAHGYLLPVIRRMLEDFPHEGVRALDLGCGNGSLTAQWARPGWKVCAVDLAESGVKIGKEAHPNIEFCQGDVTGDLTAMFGPEMFDMVVSAEVIEHLYFPRALVRNAYRLLKPGGLFVLTTPYHGYLKNVALALTGKLDAHFTALWDGGHIKFWSRKTLTEVLEEAGFVVEAFAGAGRVPWLWKSMVFRCRKPAR